MWRKPLGFSGLILKVRLSFGTSDHWAAVARVKSQRIEAHSDVHIQSSMGRPVPRPTHGRGAGHHRPRKVRDANCVRRYLNRALTVSLPITEKSTLREHISK